MTVDTAVNIEEEKCGLDMMSSCEDLPPTSVGGGGYECNGDGKDDYVFVNGSDTASDDHVEVDGNAELNVSESNADCEGKTESGALNAKGGDQLEICNGHSSNIDNVVEVGVEKSKPEDGIIVIEASDDKVEGAELVKANGEIKSESEVAIEDTEVLAENGVSNDVEGEVDVKVRDLEVMMESDVKSIVDGVKDGESSVLKGDDSNALGDDGIDCPSLDDDDKVGILPDIDSLSDRVQNGTTAVEPKPEVVNEEQLRLGQLEYNENHAKEPEKLEDEPRRLEVVEDNSNPHINQIIESDPVDGIIKVSEPLEADVGHQPQEDSVVETQPPDVDVKVPDSEPKELLLDEAITEKASVACQKQDIQPDGSEELGPAVAEAEVGGKCDLDSAEISGSQDLNFVDSEPAVSGQQQTDLNEHKDQDASHLTTGLQECQVSQTVSDQCHGAGNQNNLELTASEVDGSVLNVQSDETTIELTPEVKETLENSTEDMPSDKPVADHELDTVQGEGKEELIAQVEGNLDSSVEEVSCEDQVAEEILSVDIIEKEVSLEDLSLEKTVMAEEAANMSKLKSANEAVADEEGKDLDAKLGERESENEVNVPESSQDSGSHLRSEDGDSIAHVSCESDLVPCDSNIMEEQGAVNDGSYAGDNCIGCSVDEQSKLENSNDAPVYPVDGAITEIKPVDGWADVASKTNCDSEDTLKPKISFGSFECSTSLSHNDINNVHTGVLNSSTVHNTSQSDIADEDSESTAATANGVTLLNHEANGLQLNHDEACLDVVSSEQINTEEVSAGADSVDGLNVNPDLVRKPFYYLIRIPRFDDVKLTEKIKESEMRVEKETRNRDAARIEFQKRKALYWEIKSNFEAARSEERAAHKLMIAKKREIDSAHSLVNLARNAVTVEDVDSRILNMERTIQHETLQLAEEKRLVREIKQLNQQREQLAANTRRQQELQQALDRRVETEEQLKVLRKELDALRDNYSKAEEIFKAAKKTYDEESALLNDLRDKFRSVDTIRQEAYAQLQTLKKQAFEKNKLFYNYKDDAKAANDYAGAGEKENLERHCVNQVEKFMELWNKNDEFRKEYLRCNMKSTLRRFRTLDGRALGPDEEPPYVGNFSDNRVNASAKVNSVDTTSALESDFPLIAKKAEESSKKVIELKNKTALVQNQKQSEITSKSSLAEPSGRIETKDKEEENKLTKEEEELARKAEQKLREEEAARLREQRRLEEKAKAQEALERKRRMAEKAQARAEFRARKEAEEKEKEREKRAKKKGKKKVLPSQTAEIEPAELPESSTETIKEPVVTEKPVTVAKRSHKLPSLYTKEVKTTKSIPAPPAPLRNRGKKRIPQWLWGLGVALLCVLLIFPLGNIDIVGYVKHLFGSSH